MSSCNVHHVLIGRFPENLGESVSSSASAQHQLAAVAALGRPLVDITGAVHLFVGCHRAVYNGCTVWRLSESCSNMCLCFRTRASAARQQVQSLCFH